MAKSEAARNRKSRIFCNSCMRETNHSACCEHTNHYEDEVEGYGAVGWEQRTYTLWLCDGCETGTLEASWTASGYTDQEGDQIYDSTYHPRRADNALAPKHFTRLPKELDAIYREVIAAYTNGLPILAAGGLRSLIEGICDNKQLPGTNLEGKIDSLVTQYLPVNIVSSLHGFRFMGNEALHRLTPASREDLRLAIEISEDLLNFLYELDYKAQRLPTKSVAKKPTVII